MVREWLMMIAVAEGRRVRFADGTAFLGQLWASSLRPKAKLLMTAWALALLTLPPSWGRTACEWRLSPLNRPKWLSKGITRTDAGATAPT